MDLMDRLFETDYTTKRRLLECARLLSDGQLDAPLAFRHNMVPWLEPARTLREAFARLTGDHWIDGMYDAIGHKPENTEYRTRERDSPAQMIARFEGYHKAYREFGLARSFPFRPPER